MLKTLTPLGLYIDKKILNNASAVFVQGDDHKKFLTSIVKDPAKVFYISPGRNARETPPTTREPFFLVASAWKHGKNLEQLLTLTSRIEGFRLKVAGKWIQDDYKKIVLGTLKSLNMADRVEILGEVSEGELNNLHQKASAAIIFSQEKGFGLPALEAASNAGTFIIPDDCGAARYFQNNIDGLFYKFGDDASFLDCIDKIIKHPELSYSLGASAWIKVKQEYAWSKHIAVLHNAMNNNSAKQGLTNEEKTRSVHVPERN